MLLPWGSSSDDLRGDITADRPLSDRILATARRIVADALYSLRFSPRQRSRQQDGLPAGGAWWAANTFPALNDAPLLSRLLGREPIAFQSETLRPAVTDRAILVTGAAGSIGSELCRQIAALTPRLLVAFDNAESGLFYLHQELRGYLPGRFVPFVGDIRDAGRVQEVFERHAFDALFHAAAYKHVPLMEAYPLELLKTNVVGTWNLARAAAAAQVGRFVLISTDKAVNPANVMGLTKRIAELLVGGMAAAPCRTQFASVRFGNVLGSSGSVVPIFHEQIARGGPLTVTHPGMRRYFMTPHEAVYLVLQAAAMPDCSGTLVLDMGEPVRIVDLARRMIRFWGLQPDRDIEIRYVGLRPGEKLDEDLIGRGETSLPTSHPKIHKLRGPAVFPDDVSAWIDELRFAIEKRDEAGAIARLTALVPEYQPAGAASRRLPQPSAAAPAAAG